MGKIAAERGANRSAGLWLVSLCLSPPFLSIQDSCQGSKLGEKGEGGLWGGKKGGTDLVSRCD